MNHIISLLEINFENKVAKFTFLLVKMVNNLLGYNSTNTCTPAWDKTTLKGPNNIVQERPYSIHYNLRDHLKKNIA